jgi:hypothetical protein
MSLSVSAGVDFVVDGCGQGFKEGRGDCDIEKPTGKVLNYSCAGCHHRRLAAG